ENGEMTEQIRSSLENATFTVTSVKKSERVRKAPLPFTTSTMQQEASKTLNIATAKTMRIAQQLYEGVDIKGEGTVGVITYLRTDSTRIAAEAAAAAADYIRENFGEAAIGENAGKNAAGSHAQDAHEAIRPTDIRRTPAMVKDSLTRDQFRLYQLIWKRFTASRMANAVYDTASVKIRGGKYMFTMSSSNLKSAGFMDVYMTEEDERFSGSRGAESLTKETALTLAGLKPEQHYTQPPAHYTEASLVRTLEELGIGRPSTYAPTITTIVARRYITKEQKNLYMTELGEVVNRIMCQEFPQIVDVHFTANMELLLDSVADGKIEWKTIVRNFYPDLKEAVDKAESELDRVKVADEESDVICENCGRRMVIKYGPHGKFLACPGFPECRNTKPFLEKIGVKCPECGGEIVLKRTKKGRRYFGCENNPECNFISWTKPSGKTCPKCGKYMTEKGPNLVCSDPNCGYREKIT
ncbi:MAG: DNA topoisomerase, partial [Lachnospiraceae bacterium]|nr:DNA topoisomerase [Lachnospiraceae bacterium]